jgi:hypothetical protein
MKLREKILVVGVVPPAVLALATLGVLAFQGWRLGSLVQDETGKLVREQLGRTVRLSGQLEELAAMVGTFQVERAAMAAPRPTAQPLKGRANGRNGHARMSS